MADPKENTVSDETSETESFYADDLPPNWLADIIEAAGADLATIPVTSRPTWIRHLLLEPVDSTSADAPYNPDVWELQRRLNIAADLLAAVLVRERKTMRGGRRDRQ